MKFRHKEHTIEFGEPSFLEEEVGGQTFKVLRTVLVDGSISITWKSSEDVFPVSCFDDVLITAKVIPIPEGYFDAAD